MSCVDPEQAHSRPVRAVVITLGGERERLIREHLEQVGGFEVFFSLGVAARELRTKEGLRKAAIECGLFDDNQQQNENTDDSDATSDGNHSRNEYDFERLWRDCRSINRQRAVLGCLLAHVRALKYANSIPGGVDVVFEDNVRFLKKPGASAARIRSLQSQSPGALVRLYGFGAPETIVKSLFTAAGSHHVADFLFTPAKSQLPDDQLHTETCSNEKCDAMSEKGLQRGAPLVWGCFAYWVHPSVLERYLHTLRAQLPTSLLHKRNKRQKTYSVRPFDKVLFDFGLPRTVFQAQADVPQDVCDSQQPRTAVVALRPCCYRAPMLPSLIHRNYDAGFCAASEKTMELNGDSWADLLLTDEEVAAVERHEVTGEWTHPQSAKLSAGWQDRKAPRQKEAHSRSGNRLDKAGVDRAANDSQPNVAWEQKPYVMTEADLRKRRERAERRRKFQSARCGSRHGLHIQHRRQRRFVVGSLAIFAIAFGVYAQRRAAQ